ncbi:XTP/dITP diphosphatase [Metabacillus iocasae]|uniref:dITP/XTP pyrophosphatase n=1 Tax=Priestia iocasae TaxID=2291674 RepID=A0ABS2QPS6_9BACI|nr:XTP/dITP diphosphatase [Metabacillus iocasae]MBM7701318.1 XTP/dITP diphosphohydrolase [Metabacillus iocasae]
MKELIIATQNSGKVKEFEALFSSQGVVVKSLLDFPHIEDIEETGTTFVENATIKAEAVSQLLNKIVIADDSGLAIDALNGEPGVYSARYAGIEKDNEANIQKVLNKLEGVSHEKRTARFHCALAIAIPNEETAVVEGTCEGTILEAKRGEGGFGYDPIFFVNELDKTMAELPKEQKNMISHRAKALEKLVPLLNERM